MDELIVVSRQLDLSLNIDHPPPSYGSFGTPAGAMDKLQPRFTSIKIMINQLITSWISRKNAQVPQPNCQVPGLLSYHGARFIPTDRDLLNCRRSHRSDARRTGDGETSG